eukprot:578382-Rhodomonas_salina.2
MMMVMMVHDDGHDGAGTCHVSESTSTSSCARSAAPSSSQVQPSFPAALLHHHTPTIRVILLLGLILLLARSLLRLALRPAGSGVTRRGA